MSVRVATLEPETRFRLAGLPERVGTVLRIGTGSAVVRYATGPRVFTATAFDEEGHKIPKVVEIGAGNGTPVTIALETEVEVIP